LVKCSGGGHAEHIIHGGRPAGGSHSTVTQQSLNNHSTFTQQSLIIRASFTQQSLNNHSTITQQSLNNHSTITQQSLNNHSTITQHSLNMHTTFTQHSHNNHTTITQHSRNIHATTTQHPPLYMLNRGHVQIFAAQYMRFNICSILAVQYKLNRSHMCLLGNLHQISSTVSLTTFNV
jgi:hypothetical protein